MSIRETIGEVKLWNTVGDSAPEGYNNIEFSEIALKTDLAAAVGGAIVPQTNGFTITAGTTPKTLTVPLAATVSGTNTGDETKAGLIAKLAIPGPFVDDAAAATGGVAVGGLYHVTTTLALQVRVA